LLFLIAVVIMLFQTQLGVMDESCEFNLSAEIDKNRSIYRFIKKSELEVNTDGSNTDGIYNIVRNIGLEEGISQLQKLAETSDFEEGFIHIKDLGWVEVGSGEENYKVYNDFRILSEFEEVGGEIIYAHIHPLKNIRNKLENGLNPPYEVKKNNGNPYPKFADWYSVIQHVFPSVVDMALMITENLYFSSVIVSSGLGTMHFSLSDIKSEQFKGLSEGQMVEACKEMSAEYDLAFFGTLFNSLIKDYYSRNKYEIDGFELETAIPEIAEELNRELPWLSIEYIPSER